jgi:hypothetical protein
MSHIGIYKLAYNCNNIFDLSTDAVFITCWQVKKISIEQVKLFCIFNVNRKINVC